MASTTLKSRIEHLIAMAQLLERVDANPALIGAAQYQHLSRMVQSLLSEEDLPAEALHAVLQACPASALLYENLHYDRSGLSQSPLDLAISSELQAGKLIDKVRQGGQPAR